MTYRECEFIKFEDDTYIGAYPRGPSWDQACRLEAVRQYKFANHNSWLCQKHYDALVKWCDECPS